MARTSVAFSLRLSRCGQRKEFRRRASRAKPERPVRRAGARRPHRLACLSLCFGTTQSGRPLPVTAHGRPRCFRRISMSASSAMAAACCSAAMPARMRIISRAWIRRCYLLTSLRMNGASLHDRATTMPAGLAVSQLLDHLLLCKCAQACACAYVHACVLTMRVADGLACPVLVLVLALVPVDIAWHGAVASQAL